MSPSLASLPAYLHKFVAEQDYDRYTPQDQAAWRFIMRQNRAFFSKHAVPIYLEGLGKTGIPLDRIPRIAQMDECLSKFGWGAVPVTGFIPPSAFLEFQARGVLPIACDMRAVNHIGYTPAPDIVHEAAGHAPIIAEPSYAAYLRRYARMAQKAIQSIDDIRLYEAIRYLSDLKENPDILPAQIAQAEARLIAVSKSVRFLSEGSKVARMAWWTVEYGLVGNSKEPLIFGAGLLSSVAESFNCLSSKVRKIPLSVDCVNQTYNITEPQPQLFVATDMEHLARVLDELEKTLSFVVGGKLGMETARMSETVTTVVLDSGVEISGQVVKYELDGETPVWFQCQGKSQLGWHGSEIPGQGVVRHPQGFSAPIGRWKNKSERAPETFTREELAKMGIIVGQKATLELVSGFQIQGRVEQLVFNGPTLQLITWLDCTVKRGSQIFFEPSWGLFDQPIGRKIVSVYGGPCDLGTFGELAMGEATTSPGRQSPFTTQELELFEVYRQLRELRTQSAPVTVHALEPVGRAANERFVDEWLLQLETLELLSQKAKTDPASLPWSRELKKRLEEKANDPKFIAAMEVRRGLATISTAD